MTDNSESIAEATDLLRRLIQQSEKLVNEVSNLQRDVTSLKTMYLSQDTILSQLKFTQTMKAKELRLSGPQTNKLNETLESLDRARRSIQNIESDMRAIRSQLDQILNDSYSRHELQNLMVDPNDPKASS